MPVAPAIHIGETPEGLPPFDLLWVTKAEQVADTLELYRGARVKAVDTETSGLDPINDRVRLVQIAAPDLPVTILHRDLMPDADMTPLRDLLWDDSIKVLQHAKFDYNMLRALFLEQGLIEEKDLAIRGQLFDTQLASQILGKGLVRGHDLGEITNRHLGIALDKSQQDWFKKNPHTPIGMEQLKYAAIDAQVLVPLREKMRAALVEVSPYDGQNLVNTAMLEFSTIRSTANMEWNGFPVNFDRLEEIGQQIRLRQAELEPDIYGALAPNVVQAEQGTLFGEVEREAPVNLRSPKLKDRLAEIGIVVPNLRQETLAQCADRHPVMPKLVEWKKNAHIQSGFIESYPKRMNQKTGRLHSHFNQIGADTGRFSSSDPNLQNVTHSWKIRSAFQAEPGRKLIKADYSQIELVITAEITQDPVMLECYRTGGDIHRQTAALVMNKAPEDITSEERKGGKPINFGLIYGLSPEGLQVSARDDYNINFSLKESELFCQRFFEKYRKIWEWHNQLKADQPYEVRTINGRVRAWDTNRDWSFTEVVNAPVQGTSADICKRAMALLETPLKDFDIKLVGQVHDELIFDVAEEDAIAAGQVINFFMVEAGQVDIHTIPVTVEVQICDDWTGKGSIMVPMPEVSPKQQEQGQLVASTCHQLLDGINQNVFGEAGKNQYEVRRPSEQGPVIIKDLHQNREILREGQRGGAIIFSALDDHDLKQFQHVQLHINHDRHEKMARPREMLVSH